MARVRGVYKPSDYPGTPDEATRRDLREFFEHLFPGVENPEIDKAHAGFAITARNPRLALMLARLSRHVALDLPWSQRRDLRELAIQALNLHFRCEASFVPHLRQAEGSGITLEQQACLPFWRTASVFDDEQRLVIEYTMAVCAADVPDELFARVVARYGEKRTIEFTTAVGWFSFWAMILNATAAGRKPE